ncbi:hypothetical protein GCM10027592_45950 [Spirosoma flavus]
MLTRISMLIVLSWFWMESARGQHLYVFSVIETSLAKRSDRIQDAERLRTLATDIARYGNYTLHWYDFGDSASFTPQVVRKTIDAFAPQSSEVDIVWFYYAGKGYSDGPKAWPTLQLNGGDLPVRDLLARFRAKPVRTLLVTTDCGNRPATSAPQLVDNEQMDNSRRSVSTAVKPNVTNPALTDLPDMDIVETYRRLFRVKDVRQIIVMSSASRGQSAHSSVKQGSVWLMALTQAISELTRIQSSGQSSWKQIQEKVVQTTQLKTKNRQTPLLNRQTITCCETESVN